MADSKKGSTTSLIETRNKKKSNHLMYNYNDGYNCNENSIYLGYTIKIRAVVYPFYARTKRIDVVVLVVVKKKSEKPQS